MLAVLPHGGYKAGHSCARCQEGIGTVFLYSLLIDRFSLCIRIIFSVIDVLYRLHFGKYEIDTSVAS